MVATMAPGELRKQRIRLALEASRRAEHAASLLRQEVEQLRSGESGDALHVQASEVLHEASRIAGGAPSPCPACLSDVAAGGEE